MSKDRVIAYGPRLYRTALDFDAVAEIEEEVGSLAALHGRLIDSTWTIGELVTVCHILLARAGCSCDYIALGQDMVARGFAPYRTVVLQLMKDIFLPGGGE